MMSTLPKHYYPWAHTSYFLQVYKVYVPRCVEVFCNAEKQRGGELESAWKLADKLEEEEEGGEE